MARKQSRKKFEVPPRFQKIRQKRRQSRRKPGLLKTIASTIYKAAVALPFVPAPLKTVADVIARETGLLDKSNDINGDDKATPINIYFCGEISATMFIQNCKEAVYDGKDYYYTKYTAVRPKTISVTVTPSNSMSSRCGFYTVGMIPYTGPLDFQKFRKIKFNALSDNGSKAGFPIAKRMQAARSCTLTYNVPRDNTFLHMGVQFDKTGNRLSTNQDGVALVAVMYECYDRDSYDDFKVNDFSVDVRFSLKGELLAPDLTRAVKIAQGYCFVDLIPDAIPLRSFRDKDGKWYDGTDLTYNETENCFKGKAKAMVQMQDLTLEEMEI